MQGENNHENSELELFLQELRAIPLKPLKLVPEAESSTLDWPYADKYSFHQQAYVLNAFEFSESKRITGLEFKQLLENKIQIKVETCLDSYFFNDILLFTIALREDDIGNFYHYIQPKI